MLAGFKTTADKNLNKFLSGMKLPPVKTMLRPTTATPGAPTSGADAP
jgi:hypothetical protein